MSENKDRVLVVFGKQIPADYLKRKTFDVVVANKSLKKEIETSGRSFIDLESLIDPGSVYEAAALLEEFPKVHFANGKKVAKSFLYEGYELWWIHYNSLYHFVCMPFTQYKRLIVYLKDFKNVDLFEPVNKNIFLYSLQAYGCEVNMFGRGVNPFPLTRGLIIQVLWTFISILFLMFQKKPALVFIGDKLDKGKDHDFRMGFVYQELRKKNIKFVEFIRSLETWKTITRNILVRKRPAVYSEAVSLIGRVLGIVTGGRRRAIREFGDLVKTPEADPVSQYKLAFATHYLLRVYDDIWSIRIMKLITNLIGVRAGLFTAALERNFHTVLGCKLNNIPTVGILHGVASRYSTTYDYMTGYDGDKHISLDMYGVWSDWWKAHYEKYSDTYKPEHLHVAGLMRPIVLSNEIKEIPRNGRLRVLYIAEQTAAPIEVVPYIDKLLSDESFDVTIKFRPFRDGFEDWLINNRPDILQNKGLKIVKGSVSDAVKDTDVAVGCHSTAVLEALIQLRVPIFIETEKWGDYYQMAESAERRRFLAQNPDELIERLNAVKTVPLKLLAELREQYFGDPQKNGSAWAVEKLEQLCER